MEEQISIDDLEVLTEEAIYAQLQPTLLRVLERNRIRYECLSFTKGISYYSVKINASLVFRVRMAKLKYISCARKYLNLLPINLLLLPSIASEREFIRISIKSMNDVDRIAEFLSLVLEAEIDNLPQAYDCCSRYMQCSDAKTCVHPDPDFAMGCGYKRIMKTGIIYFGKNANAGASASNRKYT